MESISYDRNRITGTVCKKIFICVVSSDTLYIGCQSPNLY